MCNRLFQFKDDIAKNKDIQKPAIAYNTKDTLQQAIAVWFVDVTRYSSAIAQRDRTSSVILIGWVTLRLKFRANIHGPLDRE